MLGTAPDTLGGTRKRFEGAFAHTARADVARGGRVRPLCSGERRVGKAQSDDGTLSAAALDGDRSAVKFGNGFDDRKTEAGPPGVARCARLRAVQSFAQVLQVFVRDAAAGIADTDQRPLVLSLFG